MIRVAVIGAAGRMGKTLIEAVDSAGELQLSAATERPESSLIGSDAGELAGIGSRGVAVSDSLERVADDFDVAIDFTSPLASIEHLAICRANRKRMVIGTTGLDDGQKSQLQKAAADKEVDDASPLPVRLRPADRVDEPPRSVEPRVARAGPLTSSDPPGISRGRGA